MFLLLWPWPWPNDLDMYLNTKSELSRSRLLKVGASQMTHTTDCDAAFAGGGRPNDVCSTILSIFLSPNIISIFCNILTHKKVTWHMIGVVGCRCRNNFTRMSPRIAYLRSRFDFGKRYWDEQILYNVRFYILLYIVLYRYCEQE